MQINISIQLDPGELAALVRSFVGIGPIEVPIIPDATEPPTTPPNALPSPDAPAPVSTPVLPAIPPATDEPETTSEPAPVGGPKGRPKAVPEKRPAVLEGEAEKPKRIYSGERLKFDLFDNLVRSEMKRLSMDRRIPSHSLWNAERDQRLPTLTAICQRYDVPNLVALAQKLDMLPPLSATSGVHRTEYGQADSVKETAP